MDKLDTAINLFMVAMVLIVAVSIVWLLYDAATSETADLLSAKFQRWIRE